MIDNKNTGKGLFVCLKAYFTKFAYIQTFCNFCWFNKTLILFVMEIQIQATLTHTEKVCVYAS